MLMIVSALPRRSCHAMYRPTAEAFGDKYRAVVSLTIATGSRSAVSDASKSRQATSGT